MSDLFLIVGLGNPGDRYQQTRHNAGFWFLDALHARAGIGNGFKIQSKVAAEICKAKVYGRDCILARPTVFMNHSGQAVRALVDYYKVPVSQVLIAYDDLDLPPGTARLKAGGGHGGHNGLRDIFRHLDDTGFLRLRLGIGHPGSKSAVTGYVLSRPTADQELAILQSIGKSVDVIPDVLADNVSKATKDLHTVDSVPQESKGS